MSQSRKKKLKKKIFLNDLWKIGKQKKPNSVDRHNVQQAKNGYTSDTVLYTWIISAKSCNM